MASVELVLTRGIPASGKTTWAREWVAADPSGRARVNRDDLRQNLYGRPAPLPYELEEVITVAQHAAVRRLLGGHISVVVDDTNLHMKYVREYVAIAQQAGATVRLEDFDTPLDTCIDRDLARLLAHGTLVARSGYVGEEIIRKMHGRWQNAKQHGLEDLALDTNEYVYVPDETQPPAWIIDVDGTLANKVTDRSPFDWSRVGEDACNESVRTLVKALSRSHLGGVVREDPRPFMLIVSGRDAVCRPETERWLVEHGIPYDYLFMRAEGDNRNDAVVKQEILREQIAPDYHVVGVIDDRQRVVDMWRRIGLFCAQVAPGDF